MLIGNARLVLRFGLFGVGNLEGIGLAFLVLSMIVHDGILIFQYRLVLSL